MLVWFGQFEYITKRKRVPLLPAVPALQVRQILSEMARISKSHDL
jgi:hypothetical protein